MDQTLIAATVLTFLVAGAVKGVIGLGLPTVCLAVMTVVADLPTAMALLLVPSFVTNLWQALMGGYVPRLIKRLWPFFLCATLFIWAGSKFFVGTDVRLLSALLGILLVVYALVGLLGIRIQVRPSHEGFLGPVFGVVNGVLTGLTGSFVVPGVLYLQALGLARDEFIAAMGVLFTLATLGLAIGLAGNGLITTELGLISLAGLVPALVGMVAGQKIRGRLSESGFRRVFLCSVLLLGAYICFTALTR